MEEVRGTESRRAIRIPVVPVVFVLIVIWIAGRIGRRMLGAPSFHNAPTWWSVILWCLFTVYWSVAARNSAPETKSESTKSRRFHELALNLALLLALIPIPGLRQRFLPESEAIAVSGLAVQALFGLLGVWARRHLGANWSGRITIKVDHRLIRTGPYRFVRHPIYTAMLGMFLGTAIVAGETHALFGLALAIFAYWRKIRLEEANLDEAFGPLYATYRRETRALVPGLF